MVQGRAISQALQSSRLADVQVHQKDSVYKAESQMDVAEMLTGSVAPLLKMQGWNKEEIEDFPHEPAWALGTYGQEGLEVHEGEARLKMVANNAVCSK